VPAGFRKGRDKIRLIIYDFFKGRRPDLVVLYSKIAILHSGGLLAFALEPGKQYIYLERVIVSKAADKSLQNFLQRDASLAPYKGAKPDAFGTYGNSVLFLVMNGKLIEM
jgi:hypothetical protein